MLSFMGFAGAIFLQSWRTNGWCVSSTTEGSFAMTMHVFHPVGLVMAVSYMCISQPHPLCKVILRRQIPTAKATSTLALSCGRCLQPRWASCGCSTSSTVSCSTLRRLWCSSAYLDCSVLVCMDSTTPSHRRRQLPIKKEEHGPLHCQDGSHRQPQQHQLFLLESPY